LTARALGLAILIAAGQAAASHAAPSIVLDPATGEVLSQERAGEPWYPASLTKLMTAYLVFGKLKSGALKLTDQIVVSENAAKQLPSKLGVRAGNKVSLDVALQAMLVYSANDMAVVLAEAVDGSVPQFVRNMNATARRFGLAGTHFANPNGLFDPRQVSSARDIGVLAAIIVNQFPEYARYFAQQNVAVGKKRLRNRNGLLRQMATADGMKTGFVCNSGYNLVASATKDGRKLIAVILGAPNSQARNDLAQMLLESGFAKPRGPGRAMIGDIPNSELGTLVPADMTDTVCKGKNAVAVARASELGGWGVNFGRYDTAKVADKALRGRMLGARDLAEGGAAGVIAMPGGGFAAALWGLERDASLALCTRLRAENAYCDVMPPESFAGIVALTKEDPRGSEAQVTEGSEEPVTKKRKRTARKKR
jgi:D-alanyl-D-alanine carboxypeptidase